MFLKTIDYQQPRGVFIFNTTDRTDWKPIRTKLICDSFAVLWK